MSLGRLRENYVLSEVDSLVLRDDVITGIAKKRPSPRRYRTGGRLLGPAVGLFNVPELGLPVGGGPAQFDCHDVGGLFEGGPAWMTG